MGEHTAHQVIHPIFFLKNSISDCQTKRSSQNTMAQINVIITITWQSMVTPLKRYIFSSSAHMKNTRGQNSDRQKIPILYIFTHIQIHIVCLVASF